MANSRETKSNRKELMLKISPYSFGVGDRFAHQAKAQLQALINAKEAGANVVPVWNKSHREHTTIGSEIASTEAAARAAVDALNWTDPWHVDADHINLDIVDHYIPTSDFYTIDVAKYIGNAAAADDVSAFVDRHPELVGEISITGIDETFQITTEEVTRVANHFLLAVQEAAKVYQHIKMERGDVDNFVTEISMDETDNPQTPPELLIILAAVADENIPIQTIAPKFTGRFNKGVDYVGDVEQFEKEFNQDLAVLAHAVKAYGLPDTLKLSVHSGSDKFSIYGPIRRGIAAFGAGLHIKTAGTTWLEELIGLAEAGGDGLKLAQDIYESALEHSDALRAPYATVIDIDDDALPSASEVHGWSSEQYTNALRHDQSNPEYNLSFRQLLHVGYKIAAKKGDRYYEQLVACEESISRNVTTNLYDRHLKPLFVS